MTRLTRVELALGLIILLLPAIGIAVSDLDEDGILALLGLLLFLGCGFALIPFDQWLENRRDRRNAERRNHVRRP